MREMIVVALVLAATLGAVLWFYTAQVEAPNDDGGLLQQAGFYTGADVAMGDGVAYTWVEINGRGEPVSLGITISENALATLPEDEPVTVYTLPLPEAVSVPPFTHVMMDWNVHGHEPPGVYDLPHIDFHFYIMDEAQRLQIGADDPGFAEVPDPKYLPSDYALVPGGVPQMGAHWVDTLSPEFNGQTFSSTFIFGSYAGQVTFYEPMITRDMMLSHSDFYGDIRQPQAFAVHGYYPTRYSEVFDEDLREYRIALEGLTWR